MVRADSKWLRSCRHENCKFASESTPSFLSPPGSNAVRRTRRRKTPSASVRHAHTHTHAKTRSGTTTSMVRQAHPDGSRRRFRPGVPAHVLALQIVGMRQASIACRWARSARGGIQGVMDLATRMRFWSCDFRYGFW